MGEKSLALARRRRSNCPTSSAEYHAGQPEGAVAERWFHAAGCRRWFNAIRSTVTHERSCVYKLGEPKPEVDR